MGSTLDRRTHSSAYMLTKVGCATALSKTRPMAECRISVLVNLRLQLLQQLVKGLRGQLVQYTLHRLRGLHIAECMSGAKLHCWLADCCKASLCTVHRPLQTGAAVSSDIIITDKQYCVGRQLTMVASVAISRGLPFGCC